MPGFQEGNLWATPVRDLGLSLQGTRLEPVVQEFHQELEQIGIRKLKPHCYLSTEWGVNFGTIGIGMPFYLAREDLIQFHAERTGHLEGVSRRELLRYLRHEMGHVVNYAYKLYEQEEWVKVFGAITQPYVEEYHPEPFSQRYVIHLPGWYAQKHPDEDWSETFAVWMTPGYDWRAAYADWPVALAKLEYCAQTMQRLKDQEPPVQTLDLAEDVSVLDYSLEQYYHQTWGEGGVADPVPPGLDGALQTIFEEYGTPEDTSTAAPRLPAAALIRRLEPELVANVYRWTGHFPERTRPLLRHLAERAEQLRQVYPADREARVVVALTTLVTALAMNHVHRGTYMP